MNDLTLPYWFHDAECEHCKYIYDDKKYGIMCPRCKRQSDGDDKYHTILETPVYTIMLEDEVVWVIDLEGSLDPMTFGTILEAQGKIYELIVLEGGFQVPGDDVLTTKN